MSTDTMEIYLVFELPVSNGKNIDLYSSDMISWYLSAFPNQKTHTISVIHALLQVFAEHNFVANLFSEHIVNNNSSALASQVMTEQTQASGTKIDHETMKHAWTTVIIECNHQKHRAILKFIFAVDTPHPDRCINFYLITFFYVPPVQKTDTCEIT